MTPIKNLASAILLIVIAARISLLVARGPVPIEGDAEGYWKLSSLVMQGDTLLNQAPIAFRTPGYPWFLAIVRSINPASQLATVVVAQAILSFASILLAGLVAQKITRSRLAFPFTLLCLLPGVLGSTYAAAVLSEILFAFLLTLHVWTLLNAVEKPTHLRAAFCGATFAATLLTRPIVLLLWVPHLLLLLMLIPRQRTVESRRVNTKRIVWLTTIAATTTVLLVAPWVIRNQRMFGRPFVTEFVGRNLWIVTFQEGSGTGLALPATTEAEDLEQRVEDFQGDWQFTWDVSHALVASGMDDAQADRTMRVVAIQAIQNKPSDFARKAFRRTVNYWRCASEVLPAGPAAGNFLDQQAWEFHTEFTTWLLEHRWSQSVAGNTVLTLVIGVATLLLVMSKQSRVYGLWMALIAGYFCVVTGVFEIPAYRYRMVVEPLVSATVGAATALMFDRNQRHGTRE